MREDYRAVSKKTVDIGQLRSQRAAPFERITLTAFVARIRQGAYVRKMLGNQCTVRAESIRRENQRLAANGLNRAIALVANAEDPLLLVDDQIVDMCARA